MKININSGKKYKIHKYLYEKHVACYLISQYVI